MNQPRAKTDTKKLYWLLGLWMPLLLASCNNADKDQNLVAESSQGLVQLVVNPINPSIPPGLTRQFSVLGLYDNGNSAKINDHISWSSTSPAIATVDANGLVSSINSGTAVIKAEIAGKTGQTTLTVTDAALVSLTLTPQTSSAIAGDDVQFSATGIYSDGSSEDLTSIALWNSSDVTIARFNPDRLPNSGLASAIAPGVSTMVATMANITSNTTFTVTGASLTDLTVPAIEPEPEQSITQADVHFEFGLFRLTAEAEATLRLYVPKLNANQSAKILIAGHTSKSGSEHYNQQLSEQRADAVKAFLILEGMANPARLTSTGFGEHQNAEFEADPSQLRSSAAIANMRVSFEISVD